MRLQAIPDQQHVTSHRSAQLAEEGPHLGGIYIGRGMQPPAQPDTATPGADNQGGDHGDLLVVAGAHAPVWAFARRDSTYGAPTAPSTSRFRPGTPAPRSTVGLFFDARPIDLDPMLDERLVPFAGPSRWPLWAPAH